MPANRKQRSALLAAAAMAAALLAAPAAQAAPAPAHYEGISANGAVAVFSTTESLVPGDTDNFRDVYVRELEAGIGYVTREASLGPTGGNDAYPAQFLAIDPAGDEVFFSTKERLTAADTDSAEDIYARDLVTNKTTLVSAGDPSCTASGCGNANIDAGPVAGGVVDEGKKAFFVSSEQLSPGDKDASPDIYMRNLEAGTTTLVSAAAPSCSGSCGSGPKMEFQGASADGTKAIFTSPESLVGADTDSEADLYERDLESGETKLVSAPGPGPEACPPAQNCEPASSAISADGAHVFFETNERIAAGDSDKSQDVYDWSGGTATRVSTGTGGGNGEHNALFEGSSADGAEAFFATGEQLSAADTDNAQDVYVRRGGETELVSAGGNGNLPTSLSWVSPDGKTAILSTAEPLTAEDKDASTDVYARELPGGPTTLVSRPGPTCVDLACGNGPHNALFAGASPDASHLFFLTDEALAPPEAEDDPFAFGDRDEQVDVYDRSGDTTSLISAGEPDEVGIYRGNGLFPAQFRGVSEDGSRVFFTTQEQLTETDEDLADEEDVYMRSGSRTLLVSRGNSVKLESELAPPVPVLEGTDPESPGASTEPMVFGAELVAESSIKLYTTPNCSGEPVATGTTGELEEGIAVKVAAGSSATFRATAEAKGFPSTCSNAVSYEQRDPEEPPVEEKGGGGGGGGGGSGAPAFVPRIEAIPLKPAGGSATSQLKVPQTLITFGPAFKTRQSRPVFRFGDATGQAGTVFVCKVDRGGWKACASPVKLKKLSRGRHLFEVRGVNAIGIAQPQPTKRSFKLVGSR